MWNAEGVSPAHTPDAAAARVVPARAHAPAPADSGSVHLPLQRAVRRARLLNCRIGKRERRPQLVGRRKRVCRRHAGDAGVGSRVVRVALRGLQPRVGLRLAVLSGDRRRLRRLGAGAQPAGQRADACRCAFAGERPRAAASASTLRLSASQRRGRVCEGWVGWRWSARLALSASARAMAASAAAAAARSCAFIATSSSVYLRATSAVRRTGRARKAVHCAALRCTALHCTLHCNLHCTALR